MTKQEWISHKIGILIKEGRPKDQAIAIAYSMWEDGDKKQEGGFQYNRTFMPQDLGYNPTMPTSLNTPQPNAYGDFANQLDNKYPMQQMSPTLGWQFQPNPEIKQDLGAKDQYSPENVTKNAVKGVMGTEGTGTTDNTEYNDWVKYNIVNPNAGGGMDLGTSLTYTGQQFGKGNTGMGVAGAGLSALKGVRNFLSGYGAGKSQQNVEREYHDKMYNNDAGLYTRTDNYLEGGQLRYHQEIGLVGDEDYMYDDLINKYPNAGQPLPEPAKIDDFLGGASPTATSPAGVPYQSDPNFVPTTIDKVDSNSARDIWIEKTGLPWSEAKRLGYTDGTAKDNTKLLGELNDPRFKKESLRSKPFAAPVQTAKNDVAQVKKIAKVQNYFDSPEYKALPKKKKEQAQAKAVEELGGWDTITHAIGRVGEVLGNPLQSFGEYAKYGELPAKNFSKNSTNAYDDVIGMINPASWASHASNAVDFAEGEEYGKAAQEALGALPAAGKFLKTVKYIPYAKGLPAASIPRAGYLGQGAQRVGQAAQTLLHQEGGYATGQQYDMSDDEIQSLIQRGYKIRYV